MHILIHKIVSLTTEFDWKTQNSDYLLEIKLANRGATTEICSGVEHCCFAFSAKSIAIGRVFLQTVRIIALKFFRHVYLFITG